jgi:L-cystine transport system permease protein
MISDFFSLKRVEDYFPKILSKFPVTINIVLVSIVIALALGTLIAVIRIRKIPVLSQASAVYVSFVRGTPIIVQLFLVYYGVPLFLTALFGSNPTSGWNKLVFVYLAYGLNEAGFLSEQIRAAIQSVPAGQTEAGYTVGLSGAQVFFRVVFPQAFRILLPGFSTMLVGLLPATALAYMVGVTDMMGMVNRLGVLNLHSLEGYFDAAVIFVVASILLERVFVRLIKKLDYERKAVKVKAL